MVGLNDFEANPDLSGVTPAGEILTSPFESLARMKFNSFQHKDQVHILNMNPVGLSDDT